MKILIASDHAGFELKEKLKPFLKEMGFEVEDKGAFEFNKDDDYPDFVIPVAKEISRSFQNSPFLKGEKRIHGASQDSLRDFVSVANKRPNEWIASVRSGESVSRGILKSSASADLSTSFKKGGITDEARGIILGGSGEGEAICANRFPGVRAAVYYGGPLEILKLSREHNDASILSIGARFVSLPEAKEAVKVWLETSFSEEKRHVRRINKIEEHI